VNDFEDKGEPLMNRLLDLMAPRRRATILLAILAAAALSGCAFPGSTSSSSSSGSAGAGSSPSGSPGVEAVGAGATDPVAAVKGVHECGSSYSCTITKRLSERLKAASLTVPADVTCRCQNAGTITYQLQSQADNKAFVTMDLGLSATVKPIRWTVLQLSGSWYADDQDCGTAATSIFTSTAPCG
jgi:hypothetical protein